MDKNPIVSVYRYPDQETIMRDLEQELAAYKRENKELKDDLHSLKDRQRKRFLPEMVFACGSLWTIISTFGTGALTFIIIKQAQLNADWMAIPILMALLTLVANTVSITLFYNKLNDN